MESSLAERIQSSAEAGPSPSSASPHKPSDIFDQEHFDATAYINELFPTGLLSAKLSTSDLTVCTQICVDIDC